MLLKTARLVALAGVWARAAGLEPATATDSALPKSLSSADSDTALRTSVGVFRVGDRLVGVASGDIGELLRTPVLLVKASGGSTRAIAMALTNAQTAVAAARSIL